MTKVITLEKAKSNISKLLQEVATKKTSFKIKEGQKNIAEIRPPFLSWKELDIFGEKIARQRGLTEEKIAEIVMAERYGKKG